MITISGIPYNFIRRVSLAQKQAIKWLSWKSFILQICNFANAPSSLNFSARRIIWIYANDKRTDILAACRRASNEISIKAGRGDEITRVPPWERPLERPRIPTNANYIRRRTLLVTIKASAHGRGLQPNIARLYRSRE